MCSDCLEPDLVLLLDSPEDLVLLPEAGVDLLLDQRHAARHDCADHEVHDCSDDQGEEGFVGAASDQIAYLGQVEDSDVADDGGLLDQRHHLVAVDRQEVLGSLGQDDAEEALTIRVAHGAGSLELAPPDGVASDAQHVDHRAREHQGEAYDGHPGAAERR